MAKGTQQASARKIAENSIRRHEGTRNKAYLDTEGVLTIGVGLALARLEIVDEIVEPAVVAVKAVKAIKEKKDKDGTVIQEGVPGAKAVEAQDAVTRPSIKVIPINSLSKEIIDILLGNKILRAIREAALLVKHWEQLSEPRQSVLIEMAYQLGGKGLESFVKMRKAVSEKDWETASAEGLDSKWARQTPERAETLMERLLAG